MNIEGYLDGLGEEAARALRNVLKKAYEHGYREGLAASGQAVPALHPTAPVVQVALPSADGPSISAEPADDDIDWLEDVEEDSPPTASPGVEPRPATSATSPQSVSWDGGEDPEEERTTAPEPLRPISAGATVGTLKARIMKHYALDRFIVDIIVCRKGDKDRRQLKSNVRLSKYVVKG